MLRQIVEVRNLREAARVVNSTNHLIVAHDMYIWKRSGDGVGEKPDLPWQNRTFFFLSNVTCLVQRNSLLSGTTQLLNSYKSFPHTLLQTRIPFKSIEFEGRAPPSANTGRGDNLVTSFLPSFQIAMVRIGKLYETASALP